MLTHTLANQQKRIRVLIAAPKTMVGGQARAAHDIVDGFANDPSVDVDLQPIDPRLSGRAKWLTETKLVRSVVRVALYVTSLLRSVRHYDVVHVFCAAHFAFFFGAIPAVIVARAFRKPIVINYHDGRAASHMRWWGPVVRWTFRRAAVVVVPSEYLRQLFRGYGIDAVVVQNVVDTTAFNSGSRVTIKPRLISARLLEPLYDVGNTIRAFALLRERFPNATLDIYGDGVSRSELERLASELGREGIHFHGAVSHKTVVKAFAEGGIMVNSSHIDNAPHVIIEAFAAGLPVVTTRAGGIIHMVEDGRTGLLVDVGQPASMAAAIERLLVDESVARELVANGRAETARYTWSAAQLRWSRIYRSSN